jgi:hypothetical protein
MKYLTVPMVKSNGHPSGRGGKTGVGLTRDQWVNAGIMIPESAVVKIGMMFSLDAAHQSYPVALAFIKGFNGFEEKYDPYGGIVNATINTPSPHTVTWTILHEGLQVNDGEYLGIRIQNRGDFELNINAIFLDYR